MVIRFWGVRGSTPSPGQQTARFGGNTACVSVEVGGKVLVLDAGTGIRLLGRALREDDREIFMLVSHLHGDHVQGFPFFEPLFTPGRIIHVLNYQKDGHDWSLLDQLDGVQWPMRSEDLPSRYRRVPQEATRYLGKYGLRVTRLALNHPGGAFGYRIEEQGRSFVYMTDNELHPPHGAVTSFAEMVSFVRGASVLCHDAQYLAVDMPEKSGWGHSPLQHVCQLAIAGGVAHLLLFHHDPDRSDEMIDQVQRTAQGLLDGYGIRCTAAFEGLALQV